MVEEERVPWRHWPPYLLLWVFCGALRLLPEGLVYRLASGLSRIAFLPSSRHRRVALANLDLAFGGTKTAAERRHIARGSFRNLFLTMVEFTLTPKIRRKGGPHITLVNRKVIETVRARGKGLIFLVSHFGNWEFMAMADPVLLGPVAAVGRPFRNPLIYREIERLREMNNLKPIRKKWVAQDILDLLGRNWCVAVLSDQYAGRFAPFVPFFGRPVSTTPSAVVLALKTGAAIVPVFDLRVGYGRHEVHVCEPIELPETGNQKADIEEGCARMNRVLEEWVRRRPDHWLWMARRWRRKKRPEEE